MTRRPLLWIAATAVALGVVAWAPAPSGAQGLEWTVTIDEPTVAGRDVTVRGQAIPPLGLGQARSVTISMSRRFDAPQCGGDRDVEVAVTDGRYEATLPTACNGPYDVVVTAHAGSAPFASSSEPETRRTAVASAPAVPDRPDVTASDSAVTATWDPTADPDAAGWILVVDDADVATVEAGATQAPVAAGYGKGVFQLKALRWGAGGPGSQAVASEPSGAALATHTGGGSTSVPTIPEDTSSVPGPPPSSADPPGGGGARPPGTSPPTTGRVPTPSPGSDAPLPEGYTEDLPYGVPDGAFVPGDGSGDEAGDDEQSASGTSPSAGLVRTSERSSPGLVAPFALGLLMITIAAHIAWYLRRSKPTTDGGQVTLH